VVTIPVSALEGDNVVERSARTPWYEGPTLLGHLEPVPVVGPEVAAPFRMPVQYVIRHHATDYRGYAGRVAAGTVAPGDAVVVLPGGARTTVTAVDTADGPLDAAGAGRSVAVRLADDIDIARGDVLAAADAPPRVTTELDATLCWLADGPLRAGARLLLKHGARTTPVVVGALGARLDIDTVTWADAPEQLAINDIARVALRTADPLPVDDYADIRATGGFLLIDPPTGNTLAAGLVGAFRGVPGEPS
jgi:sulfate adenylyltransferase subunit 1